MSVELVEPALERALNKAVADVERALDHLLPKPEGLEARVIEAMRYAIFAGGKRLRPFLVLQTARLFGVGEESALRVAAALEAIHTYSLVHDDLPCMDDDDLRRGQPTVHRKFDEATAVLAGDALLTFAFEVIAHEDTHADPRVRCDLVAAIARASGAHGMVGGQMIDLDAEERAVGLDLNGITRLQQLKTGALIAFGCEAGGILGKAADPARLSLKAYAHDVGLAFQIADDLIDVEGDAATAGKAVGKDAAAGKATFVSILGIERARQQARMLADQAKAHLGHFDDRADLLRLLADYVVERKS
jgi:farnesyl diphosphate synthase